jgi:hypothetical protein
MSLPPPMPPDRWSEYQAEVSARLTREQLEANRQGMLNANAPRYRQSTSKPGTLITLNPRMLK